MIIPLGIQKQDYYHQIVKKNDFFGRSVSIYEDTIAIGADGTDDSGTSSGSVYIFRRYSNDIWTETAKLIPPSNSDYDLFGGSISLYGDSLVIGADGDSHEEVRSGAVWFYKRTYQYDSYYDRIEETWSSILQLYASDRSSRDLYGSDVAIYETNILIGAEVGDGYDINSGACYVYTIPPDNLNELLYGSSGLSTTTTVFLSIIAIVLLGILWGFRKTLFPSYFNKTFQYQSSTKQALREMVNLDDSSISTINSGHNLMNLTTLSNSQPNRPAPYSDLLPPPMNPKLDEVFGDEESDGDNSATLRL